MVPVDPFFFNVNKVMQIAIEFGHAGNAGVFKNLKFLQVSAKWPYCQTDLFQTSLTFGPALST